MVDVAAMDKMRTTAYMQKILFIIPGRSDAGTYMSSPLKSLVIAVGVVAIVAPGLHIVSDAFEWSIGGFSRASLLVTYAAFLPMPFLLLGLQVLQARRAHWIGLIGALLYGIAFVYFLHTALVALEESVPDYETLWRHLGWVYTAHGALMILGGVLFGISAIKARVLSRFGTILFLIGITVNLVVGLTPLPDIVQTIGSAVRNVGLMCIGGGILRDRTRIFGDLTEK
jgi:hypothetical protein